jgi:hypothetical protein
MNEIKFKVTQAPDTLRVKLEIWRKYGEKEDDWVCYETLTDMKVSELKALADYIYSKIKLKS